MTSPFLMLALMACSGKIESVSDDTATTDAADDTGPTSGADDTGSGSTDDTGTGPTDDTGTTDTDTTGGTINPEDYLTYGPALPDCTAQSGAGDLVALSGVALTPVGPEAGYVVYSQSSGEITCVGADCDVSAADVVCTEGVISPGIINAHDHMQYNVLYPWQHEELFDDRYDWQAADEYDDYREAYLDIYDDNVCEIMKWGELRNVVAGSTALVGSSGTDSCIAPMQRNLDEGFSAHGLDDYDMYYGSGRPSSFDDDEWWMEDVPAGDANCAITHVAEGVRNSVSSEIDHMFDIGATGDGFGYVHATDASTLQLAVMAETGTTIVWSPRSNLDLYAQTTPAALAMTLGVPVVVAPDWTWSGSTDPRNEMACMDEFLWATGTPISDASVWRMTTSDAAALLRLEGTLGSLVAGAKADIAVYDWSDTPYRAVIDAEVTDTRLVVIDGGAVFGLTDMTDPLSAHPEYCEIVDACGESRSICLQDSSSGDGATTYAELEFALSNALGAVSMPADLDYANDLFPVFVCEDVRDACDPTSPADGDADGDGISDDVDLCDSVYDPLQWDHDGDGRGDFCDPCPLAPDVTDCPFDPEDIDGDGVLSEIDDCPYNYDPEQLDSDGDGVGDGCDACPEEANPGGGACAFSVEIIADETHPDHPPEGTAVTVTGVVVTGISSTGYFAQDPTLTEHAGIWVYDTGDALDAGVSVGDEVTVSGTYVEYYDLAEIENAETTVTGTGSITPLLVEPCDVGTGGADSERYESMLIRVEGLSVTDENPDSPDDYGAFVVNDCLWVDDVLSDEHDDHPSVGTSYSAITGPLDWRFSQNRIQPRSAADLEE